jgi:hypothetical protein
VIGVDRTGHPDELRAAGAAFVQFRLTQMDMRATGSTPPRSFIS